MEVMGDTKDLGLGLQVRERDDVSSHMHGIKSEALYAFLQKVAGGLEDSEDECMALFKDTSVADVLGPLLEHIQVTIPSELFLRSSAADQERIALLCDSLRTNFLQRDLFPFTIRRICELCFDPFRYFRPSELTKFVHALEKCCLVTTPLDTNETSPDPEDHKKLEREVSMSQECATDDEDVSLVRIPWLEESGTKVGPKFLRFLKEIDGIMSENFQLDADEDEDEMDDDNDINMGGVALGDDPNVIVEEYYEDPGKDEYAEEGILGHDDDDDDDDEDDDADYNGVDEDDDDDDTSDDDDDGDNEGDDTNDDTESKTPRKRKPTELDTFDYSDVSITRSDDLTTPKKHKQDDTLVIQSPVDLPEKAAVVATASIAVPQDAVADNTPIIPGAATSDTTTLITTAPGTGDSVLFSPSAGPTHETPTEKILPITTESVETSPLGNKTR